MTARPRPSPAGFGSSPADRYVSVDDVRLRYRDEGHGSPILLVHGWTLDLEMWDPQVEALQDSFRVVRLDRRGHGCSGGIPDLERDGTDLLALCRHLGLHRVALVGMSQGARAVLGFANIEGTQVRAMILDGPPALQDAATEDEVPVARFAELVRTEGLDAFRHEWSRHPLMQLRTQDSRAHALLAAMIERYPGNDLTHPSVVPTRSATGIRLPLEPIPTLILNGEHDIPSRVRAADLLGLRLPASQRAVICRAGHLPNLDNPQRYNELCRAFLSRHLQQNMSS